MKQYIENLQREKTESSNPSTNTDLANSLELLSSGIYTEEERFVFELLQNAVDAHSNEIRSDLDIKIVFQNGYLVFMHNGEPFSKRDIEGICSVGNGNKSKDIKKIGYKGIGFKSVFMHSDLVYIKSREIIFRFEKSHWDNYYNVKTSETGREYKMPWQIIPIYTEVLPFNLPTDGYNVCTYIKTSDSESLYSKLINLLSNCQFLLFLKNDNVMIKLYRDGELNMSIGKRTEKSLSLSNSAYQSEVSLFVNNEMVSKWLIYKNDAIPVPDEVKRIIRKDPKTPQKLQDAETFDISFAIYLTQKDKITPVPDSVLYTYLPTSCKFGLPFLVNANFLTDAGRQQLVADSEWNKMVISSIPKLYLSWISTLSSNYVEYIDVLPSLKNNYKVLGEVFESSLKQALAMIAFIPSMSNGNVKLKVSDSIMDTISLYKGLSADRYNQFVKVNCDSSLSVANIISNKCLNVLKEYGVYVIKSDDLSFLLEDTSKYLNNWTEEECLTLCKWLKELSFSTESDFVKFLAASSFLLDEGDKLASPNELFFPTNYKDDNEIAETARILSPSLFELFQTNDLENWLQNIGVQEMSHLSVIENVLCKEGFITKENAIEVLQFIFDVNKEEDIFSNISKYTLDDIQILTTKGNLKPASQLYLDNKFKSSLFLNFEHGIDLFVSHNYIRESDDPIEWLVFLKKLGASDEIQMKTVSYGRDSRQFKRLSQYAEYARLHEYNTSWDGRKFYMYPSRLDVKFVPLLDLYHSNYNVSKLVWNKLLCTPTHFNRFDDSIFGSTGWNYTKRAYLTDNSEGHRYLGKNYLPWVLENYSILPSSDGALHKVTDIYENTEDNKYLFGSYQPVLDVECVVNSSWREYLNFKTNIDLCTCLDVLKKISIEEDSRKIKENYERVSLLYRYICENFDLTNEHILYQIEEWGLNNTILSVDNVFITPSNLVLVSDDLGKLDIANQVYKGKHIENRCNRFATLMETLGVKFIKDFKVEYGSTSSENTMLNNSFIQKECMIALLASGTDCSEHVYEETRAKISNLISKIRFVEEEDISFVYGEQKISKQVYADNGVFHYVGKWGIANIEMLHHDIAKYLSITSGKATLIAIMQMTDLAEIKDYLQNKGFDTQHIDNENINIPSDEDEITKLENENARLKQIIENLTSGRIVEVNPEETEMSNQKMYAAQLEAQQKLIESRPDWKFPEHYGECDEDGKPYCFSTVNVKDENGQTLPIVLKSYKSQQAKFKINPEEWEWVVQNDAKLLVYTTINGDLDIVEVPQSDLVMNQSNISITFSSENLDKEQFSDRVSDFADTLHYFTGLHFNFDRFHIAANATRVRDIYAKQQGTQAQTTDDDI